MQTAKILDPICDMIVRVADAHEQGLTLEYPDREYAFCSPGCQATFAKDPNAYIPKVETWVAQASAVVHPEGGDAHAHVASAAPEIDAGIRAWYESCRCCLSDAYPSVVEILDGERSATARKPADAGICEIAETRKTETP